MTRHEAATGLVALPLAAWERDGVRTALLKAALPAGDVEEPGRFFWRFEHEDTPAGFGGMELHGADAVLRSIVVLGPVRRRGIGAAIVAMLETEAGIGGARTAWLAAASAAAFFAALGYEKVDPDALPEVIRNTPEFSSLIPAKATVMTKRLA